MYGGSGGFENFCEVFRKLTLSRYNHVPRVKNTPIGDGKPLRKLDVALGLCQLSIGSCEKGKVL